MTDEEYRERSVAALEAIAESFQPPDVELAKRVRLFEGFLRKYVDLMDRPGSANEEWLELKEDVKVALDGAEV